MMADDTAAIIEQLGLGPVDVAGHSDGANLALILARDHPRMFVVCLFRARTSEWIKFLVVDGQAVELGSFNFTVAAEKSNAEDVIVLRDQVVAQRYSEEWDRLWNESEEMKPRYSLPHSWSADTAAEGLPPGGDRNDLLHRAKKLGIGHCHKRLTSGAGLSCQLRFQRGVWLIALVAPSQNLAGCTRHPVTAEVFVARSLMPGSHPLSSDSFPVRSRGHLLDRYPGSDQTETLVK
jgi:pimeloyl-ACP methyl ester carboxylesterase